MADDRKKKPQEVSGNLQNLFTRKNWTTLWQTYTLVRKWPEIAGKNIAKKSEPAYIQKDILWIYVQSSVMMQHMQHQKTDLLNKVNDFLPDAGIKDIRWAMQPAYPKQEQKHNEEKTVRHLNPEEQKSFEEITSTVEDTKCREALRKLWRTYHSR